MEHIKSQNALKILHEANKYIVGQGDGRISKIDMENLLKFEDIDRDMITVLFHIYQTFNLTESAKNYFQNKVFNWAWFSISVNKLSAIQ